MSRHSRGKRKVFQFRDRVAVVVQAELGRLMAIEDCCHLAQESVAEQHSNQSKQIEASVAELQVSIKG